jgi:membrane-associated phospholipid phosphatase
LTDGPEEDADALVQVAGLLLAVVKVLWPKGLNTSYYLDLNNFSRHTAWAHGFMHDYALWLGLVLLTVLFLVAYLVAWWRRDSHATALLFLGGAGTLIAFGVNQIVGHAAQELRPYDTFRHALVLVGKANDYAFPSDHAVLAGALFMSILLVVRRAKPENRPTGKGLSDSISSVGHRRSFTRTMVVLAAASAVLGLFLCFARAYVGAHYPGDVVAGLLLGIVVVVLVSAARPLGYRAADHLERTRLVIFIRRPLPSGRGRPNYEQMGKCRAGP